jgi:hypothetical protein
MQPPPGLDAPPGYVCHLGHGLYGLKQAPQLVPVLRGFLYHKGWWFFT